MNLYQFSRRFSKLENAPLKYGGKLSGKLCSVLDRNPDIKELCSVDKYLQGENLVLSEEMSPELVSTFKVCTVTPVDMETFFSAYKLVLTNKGHKLTPEHLEKIIIV